MSPRSIVPDPFRARVTSLRVDYDTLSLAARQWASTFISFCKEFNAAWEEAKLIDDDDTGADATSMLRSQFIDADDSVLSKWRMIGQNASALLKPAVIKSLPPARDAIYEIARAKPDKLAKLIRSGAIDQDSTVREVRLQIAPKRRKLRKRDYLASVTLAFPDFTTAAAVLATVLEKQGDFVVRSHHSFENAVKAELGEKRFAKAKGHFPAPKGT